MNENYKRFAQVLNLMVQSEVKQVPMTVNDRADPFVHHLYTSFALDDDLDLKGVKVWSKYLMPSITPLVNALQGRDMLEAEELPMLSPLAGVRSTFIVTEGPIPVRIIESYDGSRQKNILTIDFKVRHVGNYYRRIINGPLHRAMMPFKYSPEEGREFTYNYIPFSVPYTIPDTCGEDGDELPFPDLDSGARAPQSKHRYKVKDDYCYYLGEELQL